jgi:hypothetical protein
MIYFLPHERIRAGAGGHIYKSDWYIYKSD